MSKRHHRNTPPTNPPAPVQVQSAPLEASTTAVPEKWIVVYGGSFPVDGGGRARVHAGKIITNPDYAEMLRSKGIELKECD